ncbi:MAG: ANTAR domain-containing protein [Clostridia bacterium]|nr:ANTAR domain-containing protein [Clostridia bacterium]
MEYGKFIMFGGDKKALSAAKSALVSNGHIFLGYNMETSDILRHIRRFEPDFMIIDAGNHFSNLINTLEVIDEELLASTILLLDKYTDDIYSFLKKSKIITYLTKPIFDENLLQIVDISLLNFNRVMEYERKVKKLNDTLESRKVVEKAKWILVEKDNFTEAQAYEAIKKKSRDNRMPMRDIAEAIILTRG